MSVSSFHESHKEQVLSLSEATFASTDFSRFQWQPCRQVESLEQQCSKSVFADKDVNGYVAAYRLDHTHFRLNLIVDPSHVNRCINDREEYFESATASPAMQRVNEKLGYRLNGLAEVRFVKAMS